MPFQPPCPERRTLRRQVDAGSPDPPIMSSQQEGGGCAALVVLVLVIGAVVAAVISVAALVDPFSWLPPIGEIFGDCDDDYDTSADECELATRFPGFWGHVIANFAYSVAAAGLLVWLASAVLD